MMCEIWDDEYEMMYAVIVLACRTASQRDIQAYFYVNITAYRYIYLVT